MLESIDHHLLRMNDLRREADRERLARQAVAARKEPAAGTRRLRASFRWWGRNESGGGGGGERQTWVRAV